MAGLTLKDAKPYLEKDLKKLLEDAMYEADMTCVLEGDEIEPSVAAKISKDMDAAMRKKAKKFAETACEPLATAIYDFVKEIGIVLRPTGLLMAPQAMSGMLPVQGVASNVKGQADFQIE